MTVTTLTPPPLPPPSGTVETVTPALASEWLGRNTHNRHTKRTKIEQYARDMAAGRWQVNGEAIKFDRHGTLLDGQNRLLAIVRSGVTIRTLVVRGLEPDTQATMDSGAHRTAADTLTLDGHRNTTTLAAAARIAVAVARGGYNAASNASVSTGEVAAFLAANPTFESIVDVARRSARAVDCPPGLLSYAVWRLSLIDYAEAEAFLVDLTTGVGLSAGDPALVLARRFAEARRSRETIPTAARLSLIFRAWNARRDGRWLTLLRVNSTKGGTVEVPEPR